MSPSPRALLLLCGLCAVLGACSGSSSTHVAVVVDNSIDDPKNSNPNLIVAWSVNNGGSQPAPTPLLQAAVREEAAAVDTPARAEPDLAYLALGVDGSALGVAGAKSSAPLEASDLAWSADGARLFLADGRGVETLRSARPEPLIALDRVSAIDTGPVLEVGTGTFEVIAAIAPAGPGEAEDVFAIWLDAQGRAVGVENLTDTPGRRELDAAWSPDGAQLAVLERAEHDAIVLRSVRFAAGSALPVHAELEGVRRVLWQAEVGGLRDVSAAHTRDLLAVSAWTGRDWDVVCLDAAGNASNLGDPGVDDIAPSWSNDDLRLALEQRCTAPSCAPLPIRIDELEYPDGADACPRVSDASASAQPGAAPAWR